MPSFLDIFGGSPIVDDPHESYPFLISHHFSKYTGWLVVTGTWLLFFHHFSEG